MIGAQILLNLTEVVAMARLSFAHLWVLSCILVLLLGCSMREDFAYEPEMISGAKHTQLRIAVMPLADSRQHVDSGAKALAWVPLVPSAANTVDAPQDPGERSRGEFYFPDLISYCLALDLLKNQVGQVVHFAPEMLEDYDVVIDGAIESLARSERNITYGLGPAVLPLKMFGVPTDGKSVEFKATYRVQAPAGTPLFVKQYDTSWSSVSYGDRMPMMEGINSAIRESNTDFLKDALPLIANLDDEDKESSRAYRFYVSLDPELDTLYAENQRLTSAGSASSSYSMRLSREIKQRERWLESYRQAEQEIVAKQQQQIYQMQAQRIDAINRLKYEERAIKQEQKRMEDEAQIARNRAAAGALLAGLRPAYAQASGANAWNAGSSAQALQDTSAALAAMPRVTAPPPPDLTPYLDRLNVSFEGLPSAGGNPFKNLRGGSLREIRGKFLAQYRRLVTPLSSLRR